MTSFKKTGDWRKMMKVLDPRVFTPALEKHVGPALLRAGLQAQARVRKKMREGVGPKNSALTILIKGSSKPLVDHGDLAKGIVAIQPAWNTVFIGVLRTSALFNVALAVHEGATIDVTDRMRLMFKYLWLVGSGRMQASELTGRAAALWQRAPGDFWRPLRDTTTKIVIPPRPFLRSVLESHGMKSQLGRILVPAIREAIAETTRAASGGGTP